MAWKAEEVCVRRITFRFLYGPFGRVYSAVLSVITDCKLKCFIFVLSWVRQLKVDKTLIEMHVGLLPLKGFTFRRFCQLV